MSNHELNEDAADARHDSAYGGPYGELRDQAGDLHEDAVNELADATGLNRSPMGRIPNMADQAPAAFWTQEDAPLTQALPSRTPGQSLIPPGFRVPAFGTGLSWQADAQSMVHLDLVNFPWDQGRDRGELTISNIELRTIYAHLIEAATQVRAEMRERGMQVDL